MVGAEGPGSGCGQYFILLMRPRCSKVSNVALSAAGRAKYGHWSDCGLVAGPELHSSSRCTALSQLLTGPGVGGTLVLCTEVTIARLSHSDHHTAVTPHQHSLIPDQAAQHQGAVQDTLEK